MNAILKQVEQQVNQLWKEQLPIVQFENNVEEHTPIVQLVEIDQNYQSVVVHSIKDELADLFVPQSVELAVLATARLNEDFQTLILKNGAVKICQSMKKQAEDRLNDVLQAAGYQREQSMSTHDIMRAYGSVKGCLEMSNITVQTYDDLPRQRKGFLATINVILYVAKPKDVLSLAIKSPQKVNQ